MVANSMMLRCARSLGHELLVHADEQVVAGKSALYPLLIRRHRADWCAG